VIVKGRTNRTEIGYKKPSNAYGIAGLTLGIIGFFIGGPLLGIPGIVFSAIGLAKKQKYSAAGLVLSILDTLFISAMIVFFGMILLGGLLVALT